VNALTADWYFALNTKRPPFDNLQARQAINYAFDRKAAVQLAGGSSLAVPSCQILPPNFPGYQQYCPYTANAVADGAGDWTAPDIAKAKQLVQQSGTAGQSVVVNTDGPDKPFGEQMVADLNKIGYKAKLVVLAGSIQYPFLQNSKNLDKWSVGWSAWYQDYPAPSDFLNVLLGCGSIHPNSDASPNIAEFCDKGIQAKMDHAGVVGLTDPNASNDLWAQVDKDTTDQAPWVAMFNPRLLDFTSNRVKGFTFSPQWYFLLDQASVK
jgi:peptide/nickel transport system substrate-binding protein